LEKRAATDVDHRLHRGRFYEEIRFTKLLDCEREKAFIRRDAKSLSDFCIDSFNSPSPFLKQVEDTRCCRIEQRYAIGFGVVDEHLLLERVLEEGISYTRK
jgi:hypothetical protein